MIDPPPDQVEIYHGLFEAEGEMLTQQTLSRWFAATDS
jgi:hypothetical protein